MTIGRALTFEEGVIINQETKCNRCLVSGLKKPLVLCKNCKVQQHEAETHEQLCSTYLDFWGTECILLDNFRRTGSPRLTYAPETTVRPYKLDKFPKSWEEYFAWRKFPKFIKEMTLVVTTTLSQILTITAAVHHFYPTTWNTLTDLTVHLVGADQFEFSVGPVHEELLHFFPSLRKIEMIFVGPDIETLIGADARGKLNDLGACPKCEPLGRQRHWIFYGMEYHEYMALPEAKKATIAVAFNSGIHEDAEDTWTPTLQYLVENKIPTVFTCYTHDEAVDDREVLERLGANIEEWGMNTWRSLVPVPDQSYKDQFYHHNFFKMYCNGKKR
ncbi:hypothetical protein HK102_007355 [Quaeritorhiza haematococci]|nr:hypothetical protein HK102_007355 [Quaeritorhiza haematococci]